MISRAVPETVFDVTYDGPALAEGRMPVRDLAPALLSLGELFAEASTTLYPGGDPVALNIRAAPTRGSFIIDLILHGPAEAWDTAVDLLSSDPIEALNHLKELVIAPGAGLFWYIKRKRGRAVAQQEDAPESGQVRLTLDDGTLLEVPADVLALHGNVEVRKRAHRVIEPLNRPGVDVVEFRAEEEAVLRVDADDVPAFEAISAARASAFAGPMLVLLMLLAGLGLARLEHAGSCWRGRIGRHSWQDRTRGQHFEHSVTKTIDDEPLRHLVEEDQQGATDGVRDLPKGPLLFLFAERRPAIGDVRDLLARPLIYRCKGVLF